MRAKLSGILLLSVGLTLATPLFAQTFGQITGLVTDPSGAVLVGASVTVTNPQTSFTRTENTNGASIYTFYSHYIPAGLQSEPCLFDRLGQIVCFEML